MRRFSLPAAFVLLGAVLGLTVSAEETSPQQSAAPPASVADALSRAAARPADPQAALTRARSRMAAAVDQLEPFLSKYAPEERDKWLAYLGVATIRSELAGAPIDSSALRLVQARYFQNVSGLELPPIVAVRSGLSDLQTAVDYAGDDSPRDVYRHKLAELEETLARLDADPTDEAAQQAGSLAAWLAPLSDEGADLATAVRARYGRPNGAARVSRRFINLMLAQTVAEQRFIQDVILGSQTSGLAQTQAQVWFDTLPDSQQGTLQVRLEGQTTCPANTAQRRRIAVVSSAQTSIRASKQVHISDLGLALAPASAICATSVQISDVEAGLRLVERLSLRRANQLLPQAEQAASRKAEAEASSKLDQQADAALGRMNKMFCEQIRAPLIRKGALPAQLGFSSDQQFLKLVIAQYNSVQLGAGSNPPELPAEIDLGGCLHESLVNNFCESMLKGTTIEDQAWRELLNLLTGSSPRPLWVHDRTERWSTTMSHERPVVVQFRDRRIVLTFRLQSVARGSRRDDGPIEIEARFVPQITADGPAFMREGDLQVRMIGGNHDEREALRSFLDRKFSAVLPSRLELSGLVPPAGGALGKLRRLELSEFVSEKGWLKIGYRLNSDKFAAQAGSERQ